nr:MAG TPA: hypothetical protein [Caudoviricetes sp.]
MSFNSAYFTLYLLSMADQSAAVTSASLGTRSVQVL